MKLNLEQIKKITRGAVRITEEQDGIHFQRFTKEQEALYLNERTIFAEKSQATAGVRMEFRTNSRNLEIKTNIASGSSRSYFAFEIYVDGKFNGRLANFAEEGETRDYITGVFEIGKFSEAFALGEGEKEVCIYFPWSVKAVIEEINIDDGAFVEPMKEKKKLLMYGDSITQGYDALSPTRRYALRIADAFGLEEINKAIGGEVHCAAFARMKDDFTPDYITIAYGTNDWAKCKKANVVEDIQGFYEAICGRYPNTPIFTILPIWRADECDVHEFGDFEEVVELIRETVKPYPNVTVIDGYDFVPHDAKYYQDGFLHPSDEGFDHYFNNLYAALKEYITT